MKRGKVLILCGLIGSGKSTLSRELAQALGESTLWLPEPDEKGGRNPYLADYYGDAARWSFTMQMHLLGVRFRQQQLAQWHALNTGHDAVMDSSYWQDTAFARLQVKTGLMTQREFETYATIYQAMTASVMLPSVCIRILTSPETCNRRISSRMAIETGRQCEQAIDLTYLQNLDEEITQVTEILGHQGVDVISLPWDTNRNTPEARQEVVQTLAARVHAVELRDPFLALHKRML